MTTRTPGVTNVIITDSEGECLYEFFKLLSAEVIEVLAITTKNTSKEDETHIETILVKLQRIAPALKAKLGDTHGSF